MVRRDIFSYFRNYKTSAAAAPSANSAVFLPAGAAVKRVRRSWYSAAAGRGGRL